MKFPANSAKAVNLGGESEGESQLILMNLLLDPYANPNQNLQTSADREVPMRV